MKQQTNIFIRLRLKQRIYYYLIKFMYCFYCTCVAAKQIIISINQKLTYTINPLNPELNPICYLLALLGAHDFLHVSRIRVKL